MAEASKGEYLVGVDLGGTKILAGIFTTSLKCVGRSKMSTKAERGPESVIERIAHCIQDAVDECDLNLKQVRGVGIGSPGSIDSENGRVMFAGNLGWKDVGLKKELEGLLGLPVFCTMTATSARWGFMKWSWKASRATWWGFFWAPASAAG